MYLRRYGGGRRPPQLARGWALSLHPPKRIRALASTEQPASLTAADCSSDLIYNLMTTYDLADASLAKILERREIERCTGFIDATIRETNTRIDDIKLENERKERDRKLDEE